MSKPSPNIDHLIEALPYFKKWSGQTIVIKFGGSLMESSDTLSSFASDIALLRYMGAYPIVVHGGGKRISNWIQKLGYSSQFVDGLRVTNDATMEIVEMVLSGNVNRQLVTLINQWGGRAVGISGKDAQLALATPHPNQTHLGWVGEIKSVDPHLLITLTQAGFIPVIASVAADDEGNTFNINADPMAESIACSLNATKLMVLTDVDGLLIDGQVVKRLNNLEAVTLLTHPDVKGGMKPKLQSAIATLNRGVEAVHFINGSIPHSVLMELFTDSGIGTMIERSGNE